MIAGESALADWDLTIERARRGPHAEEKLLLTIGLLDRARQHSRLRGDTDRADELRDRVDRVHALLDQVEA